MPVALASDKVIKKGACNSVSDHRRGEGGVFVALT